MEDIDVENTAIEKNATEPETNTSELPSPDKEETSSTGVKEVSVPPAKKKTYIKGWRFHLISFAIGLSVLLVNMEISIVSTSLITITDHFHSFSEISWVVTAYLSTYTGFLIIWSKLTDVFGCKWTYVKANFIFLAFSAGCGASQSMLQLILCRAFQGFGASGVFSVSLVIFYNFIPPPKYPFYGALISTLTTVGVLAGPLAGGAIDNNSSWRWIFLLNVPGAAIIIVLVTLLLPARFPYHGPQSLSIPAETKNAMSTLKEIDFLGAFLLLSATILLVTALLEVSTVFSWSSAATISLLTIAILLFIVFFVWQWYLGTQQTVQEPMFPWALLANRKWMGLALTSFLVGIPSTVLTIEIPQKFQAVYGDSPFEAGFRLIAYTVVVPVGSIAASTVLGKTKFPPIFLLVIGACLQILGIGLLLSIPVSGSIPGQQYFFEALVAFGVGGSFGTLIVMNPHAVEAKHIATASGAMVQFRMTGSTIGLAIVTSVLNAYLKSNLAKFLSDSQLSALLESASTIATFPSSIRDTVEHIYGEGYNIQIKIILGLAFGQILTILLGWSKTHLSVHEKGTH